ncbi:hypothetical protein vseg_002184 [Gypsophila vaccaria]
MLLLEENRQSLHDTTPTTHNPITALFASPSIPSSQNQSQNYHTGYNKGGKGKQNWKNKKWNNKGSKSNSNNGNNNANNASWSYCYPSAPWGFCPPHNYPFNHSSWIPPNNGAGILGARPSDPRSSVAQAFITTVPPPATPQCPPGQTAPWPTQPMEPAALIHYFDTMSLRPPSNNQWYMDSGATSHMTNNSGFADPEGDSPLL